MNYSVWTNMSAPLEAARGAALLKHAERVKYLHYTGSAYDRPTVVFYGGNIHTDVRPERSPHSGETRETQGPRTGRSLRRPEGARTG